MSRIGRKIITIPAGVDFKVDGNTVTVKGPKGVLVETFNPNMSIHVDGNTVEVKRPDDEKENRSLHGLTRTLIANMVTGVSTGFSKELNVVGVGYKVQKQGKDLVMNLGYSHQVIMPERDNVTVDCPGPNKIIVMGPDKQKVGQFAAEVREKRPPEPYKGKGIRYADEFVRRKEGKAGKGGKK